MWSFLKKLPEQGVSTATAGLRKVGLGGPKHRVVPAGLEGPFAALELREGRSNIGPAPAVERAEAGDGARPAVRELVTDALRAHVLADVVGAVDYAALAEAISAAYPRVGAVRYLGDDVVDFNAALEKMSGMIAAVSAGRAEPEAGAADAMRSHGFEVNGEVYTITEVRFPMVYDVDAEILSPFRRFDPREAIAKHKAQYVVQAPSLREDDVAWTKAQANVVTYITAALAEAASARAVYWRPSQCFARPSEALEAARIAYDGEAPVLLWVQFYPIYVADLEIDDQRLWGAVTLGMAPFFGREVEMAPEPQEGEEVIFKIGPICGDMLNEGQPLRDGQTISTADRRHFYYVRWVDGFFQPGQPAAVLISPDSMIDPATLDPKE